MEDVNQNKINQTNQWEDLVKSLYTGLEYANQCAYFAQEAQERNDLKTHQLFLKIEKTVIGCTNDLRSALAEQRGY